MAGRWREDLSIVFTLGPLLVHLIWSGAVACRIVPNVLRRDLVRIKLLNKNLKIASQLVGYRLCNLIFRNLQIFDCDNGLFVKLALQIDEGHGPSSFDCLAMFSSNRHASLHCQDRTA